MTVDELSLKIYASTRFLELVPTLYLDRIVSLFRLRWVKGVFLFSCSLPPALLAQWQGSFTCYCGTRECDGYRNDSQHRKLTLEKKILWPFLPVVEIPNSRSRVRCSTTELYRNDISLPDAGCVVEKKNARDTS